MRTLTDPNATRPPRPEARFEALYRAHRGWLVAHIAARVDRRDVDTAEDLAQLVFLDAAHYLDGTRFTDPTGAAARAWPTTIARHVIYHHYRESPGRRGARETSVDPTEAWRSCWTTTAVCDHADHAALRADLATAFRHADPLLRDAAALRLLHGWTWERIGAALGQDRSGLRLRLDGLLADALQSGPTPTGIDPDRVAALIAAGTGRVRLAAALGISKFAARQLLLAARTTDAEVRR